MPRKRKRVINWGPVLAALLALNLIAGALWSPLTSVVRLRILGAKENDRQRLAQLSENLQGAPFARVDRQRFESSVLSLPEARSAQLNHNIFGRGVLRVQYRAPVAQIANAANVLLDSEGTVYSARQVPSGLRQVRLEPALLRPNLTLALAWPSALIADLCGSLAQIKALKGYVVHLDARGRLWLNRSGSGVIELGGVDALDEKLSRLRRLLEEQPDLLSHVRSLSLTDPGRPAVVPLARPADR